MADTSDVENAIVNLLAASFYPNGTGNPSVVGNTVNVMRGWPTEADISQAQKNSIVLVRVFAVGGFSRDATRYNRLWLDAPATASTLIATLVGYTITFSGTPAVGQFVGITSNNIGYSYAVALGDTLSSIAASFAAAIPGATSVGAVLTLPILGAKPTVDVQVLGDSSIEAARVNQIFNVASWSPTPAIRDSVMSLELAALSYNYRFTLSDSVSSIATLMDIDATGPEDVPSRAQVWRRDLRLTIDFPVPYVLSFSPLTVGIVEITPTNATAVTTYIT